MVNTNDVNWGSTRKTWSLGLTASGGEDQATESGVGAIAPWHHNCQSYSAGSMHSDLNVEVVDRLVEGKARRRGRGPVLVLVYTWLAWVTRIQPP
jgi:hypothetical protein